jgi:hypothetical protein
MNLNQPYLIYDYRTHFDQQFSATNHSLSNNSAPSKLLHLDVASISAVAFQCNNNPGERSVANLLPFNGKEAQKAQKHSLCFLCFCG